MDGYVGLDNSLSRGPGSDLSTFFFYCIMVMFKHTNILS